MKFDEIYKGAVESLQPSVDLMYKLQKNEEVRIMKFNKRKVAIIVAVSCMVMGTTAFAAGRIESYRSWSDPRYEISNYEDAVAKSDELGSSITIPETFENGYAFDASNTIGMQGLDADGNIMVSGTDFYTRYVKEGMPDINMYINQSYGESDENYSVDSKMICDVDVFFNQATYKFVPEGYELTEEDNKNVENPHYEISYGSDQVEELEYSGISFELNGKYYSMMSWDSNMTVDEWYGMAEELLVE